MKLSKGASGTTLIELLISLVIIVIIMAAWWRIAFATSPYREAQRRAAVEIAAGLLDVMKYEAASGSYHIIQMSSDEYDFEIVASESDRHRFPSGWLSGVSPVCYELAVKSSSELGDPDKEWSDPYSYWAEIQLFEGEDESSFPEAFIVFRQLIR